jgi:hypothetical protein
MLRPAMASPVWQGGTWCLSSAVTGMAACIAMVHATTTRNALRETGNTPSRVCKCVWTRAGKHRESYSNPAASGGMTPSGRCQASTGAPTASGEKSRELRRGDGDKQHGHLPLPHGSADLRQHRGFRLHAVEVEECDKISAPPLWKNPPCTWHKRRYKNRFSSMPSV